MRKGKHEVICGYCGLRAFAARVLSRSYATHATSFTGAPATALPWFAFAPKSQEILIFLRSRSDTSPAVSTISRTPLGGSHSTPCPLRRSYLYAYSATDLLSSFVSSNSIPDYFLASDFTLPELGQEQNFHPRTRDPFPPRPQYFSSPRVRSNGRPLAGRPHFGGDRSTLPPLPHES
jgi:hypothetical protein